MSYDLMIFEPTDLLMDRADFLRWFDHQSQWSDDVDYLSSEHASNKVRTLLAELISVFPAMNGPLAKSENDNDVDDSRITDYTIGRSFIYCCFAWSQAELAYHTLFSLAEKYRLGFYGVSSPDGQVWVPDGADEFILAHEEG